MDDPALAGLLREYASTYSVPGAALGVLCDGEVATAYWGVADTSTAAPVTPETRFAVGSLGKSMVATALVRLAEAGRLSLDDPISVHVPELRGADWAERATVRDLLANRSRLPLRDATEFATWPDEDDRVLSRVAAAVATGEAFPPVWSYTNAGWCLLGRAMETATGLVWEEAMRAGLLEPLGMAQTEYTTRASAQPRAAGHRVGADDISPVPAWTPRNLGPAGSTAQSTVRDLLRFAAGHLDDTALAMLRETQAEVRIHAWLDAWCFGWGRFDWTGGPVWGWDGLTSGQRSVLRLLPQRRGAVVLLTNSGTGRALYRSLFPELLRSRFGIGMPPLRLRPSAGAAGDLTRFTGVYAWPDRRVEVSATGTGLAITAQRQTVQAVPIDERTFLVDAADPDTPTVTFGAFDDDARPGVLYNMLWALPRVPDTPDRTGGTRSSAADRKTSGLNTDNGS
jgi:CubicO group peptidase (beta-lactamase class C family)